MTHRDLYNKYPKIFPKEVGEVGDGWIPAMDQACQYIQGVLDANNWDKTIDFPQLISTQIKEKFGTLRWYYTWTCGAKKWDDFKNIHWFLNELPGVIHYVEWQTQSICEDTGQPGELYSSPTGWVRTLSEIRAKELGFKKHEFKTA